MKKIICLVFIVGFMLSINSCQEESFNDPEISTITPIITKVNVLDNIETIANPIGVNAYTLNPKDRDDEKINIQLLNIAIAVRECIKGISYNKPIWEKAMASGNKCFNLKELSSINPLKSASIEFSNLNSLLEKSNLKHASQNPLKSGFIEEYIPGIHVVNLETADMEKQPLICPGFEVNSDLKGMEDYEDYIVAWFYDDKDSLNEILINEEIALCTSHPVFVIENSDEDFMNVEKSVLLPSSQKTLKSATTNDDIYTYEYRINHRYERSGRSEFCITAALINENGQAGYIIGGGSNQFAEIAEVHKSNIGKPLYKWELICSNEIEPLNENFIFWNTYERDWFNTDKSLGTATKNGKSIALWGHRKYTSEWYGVNPSALENSPLDLTTVVYNSQKTYSNTKGSLQFKLYY